MAKKKLNLIGIVMWAVGVLVSLAVGSSMIGGVLAIPFIPAIITTIAGWVVVVGALIGAVMAILGMIK